MLVLVLSVVLTYVCVEVGVGVAYRCEVPGDAEPTSIMKMPEVHVVDNGSSIVTSSVLFGSLLTGCAILQLVTATNSISNIQHQYHQHQQINIRLRCDIH